MLSVPSELKEVAQEVKKGKKPSATVRTLMSWFGAERRGWRKVRKVRRALQHVKLATAPDFEGAYIDSKVSFLPAADRESTTAGLTSESIAEPGSPTPVPQSTGPIAGPAADPTYRIGRLESANKPVVSVKPDDPIQCAITLMLKNDFSQLPVMTSERTVKGMISWRSIGSRSAVGKTPSLVREAIEPHHEINADASLFDAIDTIAKFDCVLVRDSSSRITGLVTSSDLSVQFGDLGEPFLLLGEIENHLRGLFAGRFSKAELVAARDSQDSGREIEDVADLGFGEIVRFLASPDNWTRLNLNLDRPTFIQDLEEIRQIRNDVMHFDPEGISVEEMKLLRRMVEFLRRLRSLGSV